MKRSLCAAAAVALALGIGLPVTSASASGDDNHGSRATIMAKPKAAKAKRETGTPSGSKQLSFLVTLPLRHPARAAKFARAVSDPASSSFHDFISPKTFTKRYAASRADVRRVRSWLSKHGLDVAKTPKSRTYLQVSGSASQVDKTFRTTMRTYEKKARSYHAPSTSLSVPHSIKDKVSGVVGLDTSRKLHTYHQRVQPLKGSTPGNGCSTYYGQYAISNLPKGKRPLHSHLPTPICGYTPQQMSHARHSNRVNETGKGVTVGITLWCNDPRIKSDTNHWARNLHFPRLRRNQYKVLEPAGGYDPLYCNDTASGGVNVEQALDVQSIHGAAPDAKIIYAAASRPFDNALLASLHKLVDGNRVDVISDSWGGTETDNPAINDAYDAVFMQAAAQGISVLFSSGDYGDNSLGDAPTNGTSPDYPASNPWITSVGGTSLGLANKSGRKVTFEQAWNTSMSVEKNDQWGPWTYRYGGGGGTSNVYAQPFYQKGVVPTRFAGTDPHRVYPDLAGAGDPYTGYLVGFHDTDTASGNFMMSGVGGTSWSSPYTAGTIALAQQANNGHRIGFLNPIIYAKGHAGLTDIRGNRTKYGFIQIRHVIGGTDENPFIYTEPATVAVNAQRLQDQTLTSVRGYDNTTGFGVPTRTRKFIRALTRW